MPKGALVRALSVWLVVLSTLGCTNNATMNGEVMLPAKPAEFDELHMIVGARRDDSFESPWAASNLPQTIELGVMPQTYTFSLATEDFAQDAFIKLSFCASPACSSFGDPLAEVWVQLEHPFYLAKVTRWTFDLRRIPLCTDASCTMITDPADEDLGLIRDCAIATTAPPTWRCEIGRCEIGCEGFGDVTAGSCRGMDGRSGAHFCE